MEKACGELKRVHNILLYRTGMAKYEILNNFTFTVCGESNDSNIIS